MILRPKFLLKETHSNSEQVKNFLGCVSMSRGWCDRCHDRISWSLIGCIEQLEEHEKWITHRPVKLDGFWCLKLQKRGCRHVGTHRVRLCLVRDRWHQSFGLLFDHFLTIDARCAEFVWRRLWNGFSTWFTQLIVCFWLQTIDDMSTGGHDTCHGTCHDLS